MGKTRLLGTARNTLIIRPPIEHTTAILHPENVEEIVVHGWNDMNEAGEYLRHKGGKHNWVWLDSASLFQDTGLDEIWADVIAAKPHRAQYGLDKGEYGVNMTRLGRWIREAVTVDEFNFGFTAHPFFGVTIEGEPLLMPYIQGKNMPEKLCGYMNMVLYYEIAEMKVGKEKVDKRVLRSRATSHYYAKDQFDAFKNGRMIDPTMPKIMDAIKAARPASSSRTRSAKKRSSGKKRPRRGAK